MMLAAPDTLLIFIVHPPNAIVKNLCRIGDEPYCPQMHQQHFTTHKMIASGGIAQHSKI